LIGKFNKASSRLGMSVIKPSVVADITFPPSLAILCIHSPITLRMKEVVQEAKIGLDNCVPVILNICPVLVS
jgi:hypothetical protein